MSKVQEEVTTGAISAVPANKTGESIAMFDKLLSPTRTVMKRSPKKLRDISPKELRKETKRDESKDV